ncbi:MAG TPA: class I SAM-dependent methyltransferase [Methylomirabilota bacterium]|jgi:16S rRNA (adenine(1408)-N(1))-methyltransferase
MEVIAGRRRLALDHTALAALRSGFREVWLDLGTGNGVFAYDAARRHPDVLVIGVDTNRDNLREYSAKARRKPARGGLPNVLYVIAAAERLPEELAGVAAHVFVNFPWGTLLRGLVAPDPALLAEIRRAGGAEARLSLLLNFTLFTDEALVETLALPTVTRDYVERVLAPAYAAAGIAITEVKVLGPAGVPYRTEWGQRLTVAGSRETLQVEASMRAWPDTLRGTGDVPPLDVRLEREDGGTQR